MAPAAIARGSFESASEQSIIVAPRRPVARVRSGNAAQARIVGGMAVGCCVTVTHSASDSTNAGCFPSAAMPADARQCLQAIRNIHAMALQDQG
ncbi:MAG TPA: hypothetical protein VMN79_19100 [Casimicrobiaceae bacterium]|nr:hypothetical protein [Casimicrobiaceae bacterium]